MLIQVNINVIGANISVKTKHMLKILIALIDFAFLYKFINLITSIYNASYFNVNHFSEESQAGNYLLLY